MYKGQVLGRARVIRGAPVIEEPVERPGRRALLGIRGCERCTVRLAERLRPYRLKWIEEYLIPEDLQGHVAVRQRLPWQTLATGEHMYTPWPFRYLIENDAVDILQPDMLWVGGLTACRKIAEMANVAGKQVVLHGGGNSWLPGPKTFPHVQYRSTAIDDNPRVLPDPKVSRVFRLPEQRGTVRDPRLAQATSFTYESGDGSSVSAPASAKGLLPVLALSGAVRLSDRRYGQR